MNTITYDVLGLALLRQVASARIVRHLLNDTYQLVEEGRKKTYLYYISNNSAATLAHCSQQQAYGSPSDQLL